MEFPYCKVLDFPEHQKRARMLPWIRIGIFNPNNPSKVIFPMGLIDSGADISIVDREFGEELGYVITNGAPETLIGMGGGKTDGYIYTSWDILLKTLTNQRTLLNIKTMSCLQKIIFRPRCRSKRQYLERLGSLDI